MAVSIPRQVGRRCPARGPVAEGGAAGRDTGGELAVAAQLRRQARRRRRGEAGMPLVAPRQVVQEHSGYSGNVVRSVLPPDLNTWRPDFFSGFLLWIRGPGTISHPQSGRGRPPHFPHRHVQGRGVPHTEMRGDLQFVMLSAAGNLTLLPKTPVVAGLDGFGRRRVADIPRKGNQRLDCGLDVAKSHAVVAMSGSVPPAGERPAR